MRSGSYEEEDGEQEVLERVGGEGFGEDGSGIGSGLVGEVGVCCSEILER